MAITDSLHADLVSAVGADGLSTDAATLMSYGWMGISPQPGLGKLSKIPPAAVVMPGSTEEVSAVVKACNRHGTQFRAFSSGWWTPALPENTVYIDLKRMNRLVKLDVHNQMAVIEPGVTAGELQAEAMRHGLTSHVVGAGPTHCPLASATSMLGVGVTGGTTGTNARNLLSFEWVTPEGNIYRIGSSASGDRWFASDGPGPGWRGMIRGMFGAMGGMGVFTKIGYKLYPWTPGPVETTGELPQLGMQLPKHTRIYQFCWDDWQGAAVAAQQFLDARVTFTFARVPPNFVGAILCPTNEDYYIRLENGSLPPAAQWDNGTGWTVFTTATSDAEAAYKAKVVAHILAKTKGRVVPLSAEDETLLARNIATSCYVQRVNRPALGVTHLGVMDSFGLLPKAVERSIALTNEVRNDFISPLPEAAWSWPNEGRQLWLENLPSFHRSEPAGKAACVTYFLRANQSLEKDPLGVNCFISGQLLDIFGKPMGELDSYVRRVKCAFDPKAVSYSDSYISNKATFADTHIVPLVKNAVFSKAAVPMLKNMATKMVSKG